MLSNLLFPTVVIIKTFLETLTMCQHGACFKSYPRGWSGEIAQKAIEAVLWTFRRRKTKKTGAEGVRKEVAS